MSTITVRFESAWDSLLTKPFEVGARHWQVAFCDGSQKSLSQLAKERVIYPLEDGKSYQDLTLADRIFHILTGTLETFGYVTLLVPFFAFAVDKSLNQPTLPPNDLLLDFYRGAGCNSDDLHFNTILNWSNSQLESEHHYIQWLFPIWEKSGANSNAPYLKDASRDLVQTLQDDPACKKNLVKAFKRMLDFYGLKLDETSTTISRIPGRKFPWLTKNNHNFKRITRIIESLNRMGQYRYATEFLDICKDIAEREGKGIISDDTLSHWERAH